MAVDNFNGIKLLGRSLRCDHVDKYKLPKEIREKEEEILEADPEAIVDIGPGHAYKDKELENEFSVTRGVNVWGSVPNELSKKISESEKNVKLKKDKSKKHKKKDSSDSKKHKEKKQKRTEDTVNSDEEHAKRRAAVSTIQPSIPFNPSVQTDEGCSIFF